MTDFDKGFIDKFNEILAVKETYTSFNPLKINK